MNDVAYTSTQINRRLYMKTQINELKSYITNLFQLTSQENWECEALNESADNILPERF